MYQIASLFDPIRSYSLLLGPWVHRFLVNSLCETTIGTNLFSFNSRLFACSKCILVLSFLLSRFPMHRPFLFCFDLFCFVLFCFVSALYFVSRFLIVAFCFATISSFSRSRLSTPKILLHIIDRLSSLPAGHPTSIPLVHSSRLHLDVVGVFPKAILVHTPSA